MLIDPDQATWALAHLGEAAVEQRHSDGSMTFRFEVRNEDAFRSFVLGFLDRAEVLGPVESRESMISWLRNLAGAS